MAGEPVVPAGQIEQGTLTWKGDKIVFKGKGEPQIYSLGGLGSSPVPGLKNSGYEKKSIARGDKEIDASELTLVTSNWEKITLVMSKPLEVNRITDSSGTRWELRAK